MIRTTRVFFIEELSEIENALLYGIANNGREALDKLENAIILPDLIFMDINMPLMNGAECLGEIIKNIRIRIIPVVMLTTDTGRKKFVHQLGAKAFIEKPCDGKTLRMKLEQMINIDFIVDSQFANQTFQSGFVMT